MRSKLRNTLAQALAPGATLSLAVDPPISETERPYVFTGLGPGAVTMEPNDAGSTVVFHNPTRFVAPFLFFVGPKTFLPPALSRLARLLGGF